MIVLPRGRALFPRNDALQVARDAPGNEVRKKFSTCSIVIFSFWTSSLFRFMRCRKRLVDNFLNQLC